MSFEEPEKVEKVGLAGKASEVVEAREAIVAAPSEGPKILFHIINLEWTILLCSLSFLFGGIFGSWIVLLWGIVK